MLRILFKNYLDAIVRPLIYLVELTQNLSLSLGRPKWKPEYLALLSSILSSFSGATKGRSCPANSMQDLLTGGQLRTAWLSPIFLTSSAIADREK